jgi:predicted Zn-dependent peptidase
VTDAPSPTAPPDAAPLAERVVEHRLAGAEDQPGRLLLLPTPVERVVSIRGSVWAGLDLTEDLDDMALDLTTTLLDKGTTRRDRFAIAEALEDRGAELAFYADGLRVGFSGRCLEDDLPDVLALLAEQLREPALDEAEFEKAKQQTTAGLRRALDSTGAQAGGLLTRRLFPPDHPDHHPAQADDLERLGRLTIEHVRDFHQKHLGSDQLILSMAGDLDVDRATEAARDALGDWAPHGQTARYAENATPQAPGRAERVISDRQNLDVRFGHALSLRRGDPDYLALFAGVYTLGGSFSGRLMSTVRDEQGLTYGVGSRLAGMSVEHDGYWRTSITLSQENLERGIEATLEQIRRFCQDGVTDDELREKLTAIAGGYKVGLATTGGLAASLLVNAERGFPTGYLDEYPARIEALTAAEVNAAIDRYLDPEALHVTVAGTLPE